jgi:hypothetical protein
LCLRAIAWAIEKSERARSDLLDLLCWAISLAISAIEAATRKQHPLTLFTSFVEGSTHILAILFLSRAHALIKRTSSGEIAAKRGPYWHCKACLLNPTSIYLFLISHRFTDARLLLFDAKDRTLVTKTKRSASASTSASKQKKRLR